MTSLYLPVETNEIPIIIKGASEAAMPVRGRSRDTPLFFYGCDMKTKTNVTQNRLKETLTYNSKTGVFKWREHMGSYYCKGMRAGCIQRRTYTKASFPLRAERDIQKRDYRKLRIDGEAYYEHRLAWLYVYGEWPSERIDHINRRPGDNRIKNLRLATASQNSLNAKPRENKTGYQGVVANGRKFVSNIRHRGVQHYIGTFDTPREAHAAFCKTALALRGDFANRLKE